MIGVRAKSGARVGICGSGLVDAVAEARTLEDVAAIVALQPDLVVMDREENREPDAIALRAAGVTVHAMHVDSLVGLDGQLAALADAFPDGAFVLNHMGFPLGVGPYAGQREAVFSAWRAGMAELARRENVMVKVGGCGIPVWGFDFHKRVQGPSSQELAAAWKPYVETTLALFGPARCMAESNYPADRASAGYGEIWNALKWLTTSLSAEDRTALFRSTAERVYAF